MSADAPAQATCTSGRARCHAGRPHDPPPRTRYRISAPGGEPTRPSTPLPPPLSCPGPLGPGQQTVCVGAMWRPRVLPDAVPRASAGGFERLLHEREGFGLPLNGQWTCGGKFDGPPEFDFCERTPAGTRVKGGWGGGVGGHRDGGSGPEFELSVGEQARGVQLPGERRRRGSRVRWQGPVEA